MMELIPIPAHLCMHEHEFATEYWCPLCWSEFYPDPPQKEPIISNPYCIREWE